MTRLMTKLAIMSISVMLGASVVTAAQELLPCTPLAPGARCATPTPGVWRLDFGAPKPAPVPADESHWVPFPHRDSSNRLMRAPTLNVPPLPDHPIDCKMVKHGDATVDPKLVAPLLGHTTATGRVITLPPCKGK